MAMVKLVFLVMALTMGTLAKPDSHLSLSWDKKVSMSLGREWERYDLPGMPPYYMPRLPVTGVRRDDVIAIWSWLPGETPAQLKAKVLNGASCPPLRLGWWDQSNIKSCDEDWGCRLWTEGGGGFEEIRLYRKKGGTFAEYLTYTFAGRDNVEKVSQDLSNAFISKYSSKIQTKHKITDCKPEELPDTFKKAMNLLDLWMNASDKRALCEKGKPPHSRNTTLKAGSQLSEPWNDALTFRWKLGSGILPIDKTLRTYGVENGAFQAAVILTMFRIYLITHEINIEEAIKYVNTTNGNTR